MTSCRPHPSSRTPLPRPRQHPTMLLRTARTLRRPSLRIAVPPWRHHSLSLPPVLVSRVPGLLSVEAPRVLYVPDRPFGSRPTYPESDLNFEELQALIAQNHGLSEKDYTLIDVREPDELREEGFIPTAKNFPLSTFGIGLKTSASNFENTYGFKRPSKDEQIIFYCRSGKRSTKAIELARDQGYTGVRNYPGGWLDYSEKMKK